MTGTSHKQADDILSVERRHDPRIFVCIPARIAAPGRTDAGDFDGGMVNVSPHAVALQAKVKLSLQDYVVIVSDEFGKLHGTVTRVPDNGFVVQTSATDAKRADLANKIEWHERLKNVDTPKRRNHKRIVPENPRSRLIFDNGHIARMHRHRRIDSRRCGGH